MPLKKRFTSPQWVPIGIALSQTGGKKYKTGTPPTNKVVTFTKCVAKSTRPTMAYWQYFQNLLKSEQWGEIAKLQHQGWYWDVVGQMDKSGGKLDDATDLNASGIAWQQNLVNRDNGAGAAAISADKVFFEVLVAEPRDSIIKYMEEKLELLLLSHAMRQLPDPGQQNPGRPE